MALEVYKGNELSGAFENKFFDLFQQELKNLFDEKNFDGVLIGFPKVIKDSSLKPDCLLITENRVLIIDFKDYEDGVTVYLPDEYCFDDGAWRFKDKDGIRGVVKGGSYPNPFAQLKAYRKKLEKLYGGRINENVGGIGLLVVFHGNVEIQGSVPQRNTKHFDIATSIDYIKKILFMIDLNAWEKNDPDEFRKKYFANVPIYEVEIDLDKSSEARKIAEEAQARVAKLENEVAKIRKERDKQISENKRLREQGDSVAEGIRLINEKEEELKKKEEELEEAKEDFGEKKKLYDIAMANVEQEIERTKQEEERTKQEEAKRDIEREKTAQEREKARQEEAKKYQADLVHKQVLISEQRKKKFSTILITVITVFLFMVLAFMGFNYGKSIIEENSEREQAEKAMTEDKKAGKTCVELTELSDFMRIDNVCVEYIVGDVSESKDFIFLNRTKNTDFAVIIRKEDNFITISEAKEKYLNKMIRVRGKISYYDGEKYKYHEIWLNNLSQVEIIDSTDSN